MEALLILVVILVTAVLLLLPKINREKEDGPQLVILEPLDQLISQWRPVRIIGDKHLYHRLLGRLKLAEHGHEFLRHLCSGSSYRSIEEGDLIYSAEIGPLVWRLDFSSAKNIESIIVGTPQLTSPYLSKEALSQLEPITAHLPKAYEGHYLPIVVARRFFHRRLIDGPTAEPVNYQLVSVVFLEPDWLSNAWPSGQEVRLATAAPPEWAEAVWQKFTSYPETAVDTRALAHLEMSELDNRLIQAKIIASLDKRTRHYLAKLLQASVSGNRRAF